MTLDEAAERLADVKGVAYKVGREEVGWVLDALEKAKQAAQMNPAASAISAGQRFLARSPAPGAYATIADWLTNANRARAIADAGLTQRDEQGIPAAVPAGMAAGGLAGGAMGLAGSALAPFARTLLGGVR